MKHNNNALTKQEGILIEKINVEATFIYDKEGYVVGVKYPDKSNFLGKKMN